MSDTGKTFEQTLDSLVANLFGDLAIDLERVRKGKDTPAEYARNTVITARYFQNDVEAAHNAATTQANRQGFLEACEVLEETLLNGTREDGIAAALEMQQRIAQLAGIEKEGGE